MEKIIVIVFDTEQAARQAVNNRNPYSSFPIRQAGTHVMRDHDHALAGHALGAFDELGRSPQAKNAMPTASQHAGALLGRASRKRSLSAAP